MQIALWSVCRGAAGPRHGAGPGGAL